MWGKFIIRLRATHAFRTFALTVLLHRGYLRRGC